MASIFDTLNAIDVNEHTEKKNNLTYLSWAWAWAEVKKRYPDVTYTVYENQDGLIYHHDGKTAWVKTGVTIDGLEYIEYLPIMNYQNKSIPLENLTSFDVNKAIQRSLTKACARHGLGLYIYAGEDLPEEPKTTKSPVDEAKEKGQIRLDCLKELNSHSKNYIEGVAKHYGVENINSMTLEQCEDYMKSLGGKKE